MKIICQKNQTNQTQIESMQTTLIFYRRTELILMLFKNLKEECMKTKNNYI